MSRLAIPASPYNEAIAMTEKQVALYDSLGRQINALDPEYALKPFGSGFRFYITKRHASQLIDERFQILAYVKANRK